jgi:PAS domain S-box-containing protein
MDMNPTADLRRRFPRAIALPTLLFGLLAVIFFGLIVHLLSVLDQIEDADRLVTRARRVSELLEESKDERTTRPASDLLGFPRIAASLDELSRIVEDDPDQSARLAVLRKRIEPSGESTGGADATSSGGGEGAPGGPDAARSVKGHMVDFLVAVERRRDLRSRSVRDRSWNALSACSGVAISLGLILAYASRRQVGSLCGTFDEALDRLQSQVDRQEREQLGLLAEAMKYYAIFNLDAEGRIATWSVDAERILGYRSDDVLARRHMLFYCEEDVRRDVPQNDLIWAGRDGRSEDDRWLIRKDGFRFKARVALVAIRDSEGGLCGFTQVVHEVDATPEGEDTEGAEIGRGSKRKKVNARI